MEFKKLPLPETTRVTTTPSVPFDTAEPCRTCGNGVAVTTEGECVLCDDGKRPPVRETPAA